MTTVPHIPLSVEQYIGDENGGDQPEDTPLVAPEPDRSRENEQQNRTVPDQAAARTNQHPGDAKPPEGVKAFGLSIARFKDVTKARPVPPVPPLRPR